MKNLKIKLYIEEKNGEIKQVNYFNDYCLDEEEAINYILDYKLYTNYDIKDVIYEDYEKKFIISYDKILKEFEPKFYTMNLKNGYKTNKEAIENLYNRGYSKEELIKIENYNEIGIVEYVAKNQFYIENNHIYIED